MPTLQYPRLYFAQALLLSSVERGAIVTTQMWGETLQSYCKRIVGLEGDTVCIKNYTLYINGICCSHSREQRGSNIINQEQIGIYKFKSIYAKSDLQPFFTIVPKNKVFLLGDNRSNSLDSRSYGAVNTKLLCYSITVNDQAPKKEDA